MDWGWLRLVARRDKSGVTVIGIFTLGPDPSQQTEIIFIHHSLNKYQISSPASHNSGHRVETKALRPGLSLQQITAHKLRAL